MEKEKRNRLLYNLLSALILIAVFGFCTFVIGERLLDIVRDPAAFKAYVAQNRLQGIAVFLAIQIFQIFFALIPGEPVELAAGVCFGSVLGTVLCMVGTLIATAGVFLLTRRFGHKLTYLAFTEEKLKKWRFLQDEKRVELTFFILFLLPGTPKDLLTYFAGLTEVDFKRFLLIATFAKIPSILTSTLAGERLMERDFVTSALIFGVTAVISCFSVLFYRMKQKKKKKTEENS